MKIEPIQINLLLAWLYILPRFASGVLFGCNVHKENWLGGYTSHRRRLYRLGHISFFGLGFVNLLFYLTAQKISASTPITVASWAFAVGAVTMPICCLVMAHAPKYRALFAVPVSSLIIGALFTLWEVTNL